MGDIGKKLGIDFVISTGDNFYPNGLKSVNDPFFHRSFTNIYTAKSLQKPWYTGNIYVYPSYVNSRASIYLIIPLFSSYYN